MTSKQTAIFVSLSLSLACGFACDSPSDGTLPPNQQAGAAGDAGDAGEGGSSQPVGGTGGVAGSAGAAMPGLSGAGGAEPGEGGAGGGAGVPSPGVDPEGGATGGPEVGTGGSDDAGAAGSAGSAGEASGPLGAHCEGCTAIALGSPLWSPAGAVMAVGMVGVPETVWQPYLDFVGSVVEPMHKFIPFEGLFGAGVAHAGPYVDEGYALLSAASIPVKQHFTTAEFAGPTGALFTMNLVPGSSAPVGSSVDFQAGPIIPNALFPIQIQGDLFLEGTVYDAGFDGAIYGYDAYVPPILVDGASHVMLWFPENSSFYPRVAPQGDYLYKFSVLDTTGAGWVIEVPFTVQD
jgi:hypothetical protein